jgi:acetyl-CoA carboxylase biotin carboxyl carrier protein
MTTLPFDADAVRMLAGILTETGLTEIEIEGKNGRIRVVRGGTTVVAAAPIAAPVPVVVAPVAEPEQDDAHHPGAVLSPMVGVAYLQPEPGAAFYVSVGQVVSAGQTLLLIEAMKTFNQIKAAKSGTVVRVLIASGAPVEYGQPLMILE